MEWNLAAAVTPLGHLPFFIDFLKASGLFDAWVADCPLVYRSNNASDRRAVLATFLLSILAGGSASLKSSAKQLTDAQKLRAILARASSKLMLVTRNPFALPSDQLRYLTY